jgi:hypothetical protein
MVGMGVGMDIEVGVCGLVVDFMAQLAVRLVVYINIKEG